MPKNFEEQWKKEFIENFVASDIPDCIPVLNWEEMEGEVFNFISNLISQTLTELEEEMPEREELNDFRKDCLNCNRKVGHNEYRNEVLEKFNKFKKRYE